MDASHVVRRGDHGLAALAAAQHGVVSRRQLIALGFGRGSIEKRVRSGRLHRVHLGVYAVGHTVLSREGRWLAAVLACGDGSVLSGRSAAALHALERGRERLIEVMVRRPGGRTPPPELRVHRETTLAPEEVCVVTAIAVTTPARTLLDLAAAGSGRDLGRAVERAEDLRLFDLRAVQDVLARHRGRRGTRRLQLAIASWTEGPLTRSELERRFFRLCASHGIPTPQSNVTVRGYEADFVWWDQRLIVEIDGPHHFLRSVAERDRVRDADLLVEGFRTLRFTERRLVGTPAAIAWTVLRTLGAERREMHP